MWLYSFVSADRLTDASLYMEINWWVGLQNWFGLKGINMLENWAKLVQINSHKALKHQFGFNGEHHLGPVVQNPD